MYVRLINPLSEVSQGAKKKRKNIKAKENSNETRDRMME